MEALQILSVDVAEHGVVVTYSDNSRAFYDESVLMMHRRLTDKGAPRKGVARVDPADFRRSA